MADDIDDAFNAALSGDAAVTVPEIPAPPRITASTDPDAPHGRDGNGDPVAPYGIGRNGRPRIKPAGPGRGGKKADAPRLTSSPPAPAKAPAVAAAARDYREDLSGLAMTAWMGGAMIPPTRPYAHLFHQAMPGMVNAWNIAAQQNASVRAQVERLAGDGSWAWVIGVCVTTAPFLAGCLQLARKPADQKEAEELKKLKAELARSCEQEFRSYQSEMAEMAGAAA